VPKPDGGKQLSHSALAHHVHLIANLEYGERGWAPTIRPNEDATAHPSANLTAIVSIGFRGTMLLNSFLYVPATIHYLGPERYGLWVAMTSIITLIAFADCGHDPQNMPRRSSG
jgi:hypothetical protein